MNRSGILPERCPFNRICSDCYICNMNTATMPEKKVHEGRNIKRIREMLGIKQETLAEELQISQSGVSLLEQKETIDQPMLEAVAKVLNVPVEAIRNFDEETAIHNIQNNYDNAIVHAGPTINYKCSFNPLDKWAEEISENRKLYERLLQVEKEKIELLQKMLDKYRND
jgi:transcriptional regulator with XRE-family HTH domain